MHFLLFKNYLEIILDVETWFLKKQHGACFISMVTTF